ncbi:MAG: SUMF1/EgtB/PvdO family nonheme iron enzyme [Deltaproteobacteria bacterium]|nr:SUMF1/EgtB/PvdO family nonheme iron enzyme [Deltaproteobacteria bacterium]
MNKIPHFRNTIVLALGLFLCGCFVDSFCYNHADCPNEQRCNIQTGACYPRECSKDADCPAKQSCNTTTYSCDAIKCRSDGDCNEGYTCNPQTGICKAQTKLYCPEGMVAIDNSFCVDIYEASRPDATATQKGSDESKAVSVQGVIPWQVKDNATAQQACEAAGKSLCSESQWESTCSGPAQTVYAYGDEYESATCNGIDTFCLCDDCQPEKTCSYPFCYNDCGAAFKVQPTGSFVGCTNSYGVYDMNGNLWEHVLNGTDASVRGGAYNCGDSKKLHQCSYVPQSWVPSARGFRCCAPGSLNTPTDGASDGSDSEVAP